MTAPYPNTTRYGWLFWWTDRVLHDVTAALCVTEQQLSGEGCWNYTGSRLGPIRRARAVLCWLLRELTDASYPELALILGCNHTTVLYNHRLVQNEVNAKHGFYLFALQRVLAHSKISARLFLEPDTNDGFASIAS